MPSRYVAGISTCPTRMPQGMLIASIWHMLTMLTCVQRVAISHLLQQVITWYRLSLTEVGLSSQTITERLPLLVYLHHTCMCRFTYRHLQGWSCSTVLLRSSSCSYGRRLKCECRSTGYCSTGAGFLWHLFDIGILCRIYLLYLPTEIQAFVMNVASHKMV